MHAKELKIAIPPEILLFYVQRKNHILNKKNEYIVYFNEEIDMINYIYLELNSESYFKYKLYGVIKHAGSLEFGHYYSYIKLFDSNMWCEFNDEIVNELDLLIILCTLYFIFLYILPSI